MKNGRGKSDSVVVPRKPSNGVGQPAEEMVEGRTLAKGNSPESTAFRTQCRVDVNSALERYVELQEATGNRGSPRSSITSTISIDFATRTGRLSRTRARASMARRGGTTARHSSTISRISLDG
jgi:hypothetical protein